MDKLQEVTKYYKDNLKKQKYELYAGRKGQQIHLSFDFDIAQLKHLMGLHKLKDMPYFAEESSNNLLRRIEKGELSIDKISSSSQFSKIKSRLECVFKINEMITTARYIYKSKDGCFHGINADYMLSYKDNNLGNIHIFLKENGNNQIVPISIFNCDSDRYNNIKCARWTILSKDKIRQNDNTKENTLNQSQQTESAENKNINAFEKKSEEMQAMEIIESNKIKAEATRIVDERNRQNQQVAQVRQAEQDKPIQQIKPVAQVRSVQTEKPNKKNNNKWRGK